LQAGVSKARTFYKESVGANPPVHTGLPMVELQREPDPLEKRILTSAKTAAKK
jgi:hypothetical protein